MLIYSFIMWKMYSIDAVNTWKSLTMALSLSKSKKNQTWIKISTMWIVWQGQILVQIHQALLLNLLKWLPPKAKGLIFYLKKRLKMRVQTIWSLSNKVVPCHSLFLRKSCLQGHREWKTETSTTAWWKEFSKSFGSLKILPEMHLLNLLWKRNRWKV